MAQYSPVAFSIKYAWESPFEPRMLILEMATDNWTDLNKYVIIDYILRNPEGAVLAVPRPNQGVPPMIDVTSLAPNQDLVDKVKQLGQLPQRSLQITSEILSFFSFGTLVNDWFLRDLWVLSQ